ncbi:MAG TPA: ATP-dependent zinc metalloprotease FtsH [Gemmataceae bacterium]|nr:ATP-dependent zinc metalloprotease FtsH [Gemmataceae bacterium]
MPPRSSPPPGGKPRRRPAPVMPGSWIWLVLLAIVLGVFLVSSFGSTQQVDWSEFLKLVNNPDDAKYVKKISFQGPRRLVVELDYDKKVEGREGLPANVEHLRHDLLHGTNKFTTTSWPLDDRSLPETLTKLSQNGVQIPVEEDHSSWFNSVIMFIVLPAALLLGIFLFILPRFRDPLGGGFLSNYIKSPAKRYDKSKMRVTFEDVADMQAAKGELQEIVEFLKSPEKFQRLGAVVPKGVLLVGPPGTGKTLLARAVAGEAGVPFFSISGSEFIQMFVGVGASRVRDMFKNAKENSPCILFIDEIDAVGRMRGAGVGGGSDEREQTLNQILSEMDGFTPTESVIVMAATNRPDVLDSALLRPGRFDRHITIDRPTWQGRMAILKVHTRNKPLADDVNLEQVARGMIGMTGADLRNLANEAALLATREGKSRISRTDFERAADRVLMGPKREEVLTAEGKRRTAYHEAGHALVSWLEPDADPPQKVSIIPRGMALGVTFNLPEEERYHLGLDYWRARLALIMGGRAADRLVYHQPFSGHEDDLKKATRLARYMVTHWGMSDRLGPMALRVGEEHVFLGKEIQEPRDFSEGTAATIDEEVQRLLREADDRAYRLLEDNRPKLEALVEALLQKEELLKEDIDQILGGRKKPPPDSPNGAVDIAPSEAIKPAPVIRDGG